MSDLVIVLLVSAAGFLIGQFLPSYVRKKGENLATKEDIAGITAKIEEVRAGYALMVQQHSHEHQERLERLNREHAMRMAALEKRLEAHQQAYALWRKLVANVHHRDKVGSVVLECQDWWQNRCLYLDPEARQAFYMAYSSAHQHPSLLSVERSEEAARMVRENWQNIIGAGAIIVRGAALPPLSTRPEHELVGQKQDSQGIESVSAGRVPPDSGREGVSA